MVKYHQLKTSVRSNFARKPNKHPEPKPVNLEKIKQQIREEVRDEFQNKNYQSDRRVEVNLKKKTSTSFSINIMDDKLLLNFGAKFQR